MGLIETAQLATRRAIALGVGVFAILAAAAAGALFLWPDRERMQASPGVLPRASDTLAFVRGKENVVSDIYVAKSNGSQVKRLTGGPGFKYDPDWSPDGKWLLYRYEPPGPLATRPPPLGLVVMRADGTEAVDVATLVGVFSGPASWAPRDGWIAFSGGKPGEQSGIYAVRRDGSMLRRLTPPGREAQYPAWSPDGNRIAFTYVEPGGGFRIYVMNEDGTNITRLTEGPEDNWPVWSPDSSRIAFSREDSIWVMDADGSNARLATTRGGAPLNWSPAASLTFSCLRPGGTIGACTISPQGEDFRVLLSGAEGGFPAWRPRVQAHR